MTVQGMRFVLGEDTQPEETGIDQIAQYEVDEAVGPAEGDGRLGAVGSQGKESLALATGEHDSEYVRLAPHSAKPTEPGGRGASAARRLRYIGRPAATVNP